jgi:hypothetical protein
VPTNVATALSSLFVCEVRELIDAHLPGSIFGVVSEDFVKAFREKQLTHFVLGATVGIVTSEVLLVASEGVVGQRLYQRRHGFWNLSARRTRLEDHTERD